MLRLSEYDNIINDQRKLIEEYQKLNSVEKYLKKMKKDKIKEIKPILFAVKYKDIGLPFQKLDVFKIWCNETLYNAWIEEIPDPNIDDLWTIVQYEGYGIFNDLTTDIRFKIAHYEEYAKVKLSKDRNKTAKDYNEACELYEGLLGIPLGISNESRHLGKDLNITYFGPLKELTPEIEMKVVKETIPKSKFIKQSLLSKNEIARKHIQDKYGNLYHNILYGSSDNIIDNRSIKHI